MNKCSKIPKEICTKERQMPLIVEIPRWKKWCEPLEEGGNVYHSHFRLYCGTITNRKHMNSQLCLELSSLPDLKPELEFMEPLNKGSFPLLMLHCTKWHKWLYTDWEINISSQAVLKFNLNFLIDLLSICHCKSTKLGSHTKLVFNLVHSWHMM